MGVSGRSPLGGPLTSPANTEPAVRHTTRVAVPTAMATRDVKRCTMCAPASAVGSATALCTPCVVRGDPGSPRNGQPNWALGRGYYYSGAEPLVNPLSHNRCPESPLESFNTPIVVP